jgi:ketosteroid isomerase-like protein
MMARVFADPDARRERNVATVHDYFRLQDERDLDAWIQLWAPDCRQLIPFAPYDFPRAVEGREQLERVQRELHAGYRTVEVDATVHPLVDPDLVLACWHTHAELVTGGSYTNEVIGLFCFDADGRLAELTEYFNPIAFLKAIGRS